MKKYAVLFLVGIVLGFVSSCDTDATIASRNVSQAADQFEIYRRVVFYNGITDEYILQIEGYCSINVDKNDKQLELMVKLPDGTFMKHFLGLSDNVTYFAEQIKPASVSTSQYRVIFRPSEIIPAIDSE